MKFQSSVFVTVLVTSILSLFATSSAFAQSTTVINCSNQVVVVPKKGGAFVTLDNNGRVKSNSVVTHYETEPLAPLDKNFDRKMVKFYSESDTLFIETMTISSMNILIGEIENSQFNGQFIDCRKERRSKKWLEELVQN